MSNKAAEFDPGIIGRMVWGSLYTPNTKDFDGKPRTVKSGPDAGKPTQRYEFGLAVPKTKPHWAHEPGWGQLIWTTAHAAFPGGDQSPAMRPDFSWKITDGDGAVVSLKSKSKIPPNQREGYPGHWVLTFSSAFAPEIYDARDLGNIVKLEGKDAIVPGYVIQVVGSVAGNTGQSPGVYLNHRGVALRAYLPEIHTGGVDTSKFGGTVSIPGASTLPQGNAALPGPAAPQTAAAPPPAASPAAMPQPAAPPAAAVPVTPAPSLVGIPGAPPPPGAVPAAPPASRPPHKGLPFDQWVAAGWTLEQMRADGYAG